MAEKSEDTGKSKSRWGLLGGMIGKKDNKAPSSKQNREEGMVFRCSPIRYHPKSGKPIAGSTMESRRRPKKLTTGSVLDAEGNEETHVWGEGDATLFSLRVGPAYARTGAKAPSAPALYDIVGVDLYQSQNRIVNIGSQVHLPEEWVGLETNHPHVPPVFIVVCQLPDVSHALSGITNFFVDKSEGPGTAVIQYYRIKPETAEALKDLSTCSPALRLFARFCETAASGKFEYKDPKNPVAGRFKVCPLVDNIDSLRLPSFVTSYNAKPALVVACGEWFCGEGFLCFDTNVHAFGGLARSAMQLISFDSMMMNWGFAVESRSDEEMPETLFGTCFIDKPDMNSLPSFEEACKGVVKP